MLVAMGNDTEHIPNTNTNDDHCPSEAHRDDRPRAPNRATPSNSLGLRGRKRLIS